jgi:RimJ/RimL family protein N-acetyltransferase
MDVLTSERLRLREWHEDDADFVLDMCSRWEVQRFIGAQPRLLRDRADALATIARWRSRADGVHAVWAVEDRDHANLLGTLLLVALPDSDETEIGWYFHPDAWGHGYAREAAAAVLAYAFGAGLEAVHAVTHPDNVASQRLCRRLGMSHLGRTDRYYDMTCELFRVTGDRARASGTISA